MTETMLVHSFVTDERGDTWGKHDLGSRGVWVRAAFVAMTTEERVAFLGHLTADICRRCCADLDGRSCWCDRDD